MLDPLLFSLLDRDIIYRERIACQYFRAAFDRTRLLKWRRVDELVEAALVQPMSAEGALWHHTLTVDALPQVRHQLIIAMGAHGRWDESDKVLSHVLDSVVDLWLGAGLYGLSCAI